MSVDRSGGRPSAADKAASAARFARFGYVAGAVVMVASLAGVVIAANHGQHALALLFLGVTLFWLIPYCQRMFAARVRPRAAVDATGTTLRPGRSVDALGAVMMLIGLATGAASATLGLLGTVTWPYGADFPFGNVILFGGFAVFCAAYLVSMARHHGTAYLRFTPTEFVFAEGFSRGRGTWAEVVTVNDDTPMYSMGPMFKTKRAQPYARCAISLTKSDGTMVAVPNGALYATDGDALRQWIHFYWQHPEHRAELTDERGLERLRAWAPAAA